jgi:hypothetical protein
MLNEAVPVGNSETPRPGDPTVCGACGALLVFELETVPDPQQSVDAPPALKLARWPSRVPIPENLLRLIDTARALAHQIGLHRLRERGRGVLRKRDEEVDLLLLQRFNDQSCGFGIHRFSLIAKRARRRCIGQRPRPSTQT